MKRVLLLGMILAIFILLIPQGVSAVTLDSSSALVYANLTDYADISAVFNAPDGVFGWNLTRNMNNDLGDGISVTIDCTQPWGFTADDANSGTNTGHMIASDGSGKFLATSFKLENSTAQLQSLDGLPLTMGDGGPQSAQTTPFDIQQPVTYGDDASKDYKITIASYIISLNFLKFF